MTLKRVPQVDLADGTYTIEEKEFYGPQLMPRMHTGSAKIAPLALVTPLFSIARERDGEALPEIDVTWHNPRGNLRYVGPTLTQSHLTAYLATANLLAGGFVSFGLDFHPSDLLRRMKWSTNTGNIDRLRKMFDDMKKGQLRTWPAGVDEEKNAERVSLVDYFKPSDTGEKWTVRHSKEVLEHLFYGGGKELTSIDLAVRKSLGREGLATWLFGFIRAESCKCAFSYEQIHAASGSKTKDVVAFGGEVRQVLVRLRESGRIVAFTTHRGGFRVQKRPGN